MSLLYRLIRLPKLSHELKLQQLVVNNIGNALLEKWAIHIREYIGNWVIIIYELTD